MRCHSAENIWTSFVWHEELKKVLFDVFCVFFDISPSCTSKEAFELWCTARCSFVVGMGFRAVLCCWKDEETNWAREWGKIYLPACSPACLPASLTARPPVRPSVCQSFFKNTDDPFQPASDEASWSWSTTVFAHKTNPYQLQYSPAIRKQPKNMSHVISNNVAFWQVQTETSCSLLLSIETQNDVQSA